MRLFLAVELSAGVREGVAAFQRELEPRLGSVRWVPPENLHLTVRFIGEEGAEVAEGLSRTLPERLENVPPCTVGFRGFGCFPNPKRARILWVGVDPVPEELRRVHALCETTVTELGVEPETRPFRPHLTIGRVKRRGRHRTLEESVPAFSDRSFGELPVSEVVLFESLLSSEGARHTTLERFRLGGSAREQLV